MDNDLDPILSSFCFFYPRTLILVFSQSISEMATEEPVPVVDAPAPEAVETETAPEDNNPAPKAVRSKKTKEPKAKKPPAPRKRGPPSHPPYFEVFLS